MDTGGKIRTGNILRHLSKHHDITLISNVESPKDDQWIGEIKQFCTKFIPVKWREVRKGSVIFFIRLFLQMFSRYPVSALNDYSATLKTAIEDELKKNRYDIAICDFVQSALLFKKVGNLPTLLFQHNVESMIAKRHVQQNNGILVKMFWWLQWEKMSFFEKAACKKFTSVIAVSQEDKRLFKELYGAGNVSVIPTGVDLEYYNISVDRQETESSLVFCGSMDWLPNEDAILFFINEILPEIKKSIPKVNLTVIGRNPSSALSKIVDNVPEVDLTGWVKDTRPHIEKGQVFIVPIRIGGGTRMKIYEAMAMGKAIVSTTIGAEGLPVKNDIHLVFADQPQDFAKRIVSLFNDQEKRKFLGNNARTYVEANFGWPVVADIFSDLCVKTVNKKL